MKQVQIPYDLLLDLCRWHLSGVQDEEIENRIKAGLQDKMNRAAAREAYAAGLERSDHGQNK